MHDLTVSELVPYWIASRTYASASRKQRTSIMRRFVEQVGDVRPADIEPLAVFRWWESTATLASTSRRAHHVAVRSFVDFCCDLGLRQGNPVATIRRPKEPRGVPRSLSVEEVRLLRAAVQHDDRMRMAVALGLGAGLRASEIVSVRQRDVMRDGDPLLLVIRGKGGNTDVVPVTCPHLLAELEATRHQHGRLVLMSANTLTKKMGPLMRSIGVEDTTHALRHTYATMLLREGVDVRTVSSRMRHRDVSTTSRYLAPL
jgi:site-specific recombinase XerD